jgi:hypothetical protein
MINRTVFIMLPCSVDGSAAVRWRSLKQPLQQAIGDLPDYRPEGAFVFLEPSGEIGELPFSAMLHGELPQFLLTRCTGDRLAVSPEE